MTITNDNDSISKQVLTVPLKWRSEIGLKVASKGKIELVSSAPTLKQKLFANKN